PSLNRRLPVASEKNSCRSRRKAPRRYTCYKRGKDLPGKIYADVRRPQTTGFLSVRHPVHDVVDAQLVGLVGFIDRPEARRRELPEVGDIGVVIHDGHHPLLGVVVLEESEERRPAAVVRLWNDVERIDPEK